MRVALALVFCSCVTFKPGPACDGGEPCPEWVCECAAGTAPAGACSSGRCAEAASVCRGACEDAGTCWKGRATGGWPSGNSVGTTVCTAACGDRDVDDLGKPCAQVAECATGLCLGSPASFICAKSCTSSMQCPAGWVCGPDGRGTTTCFIGAIEHAGQTVSTNASCKQIAFSDIGMICTTSGECESKVCFGSSAAGFFCSRRCNDDSLCVTGFRCVTATAANARFCEKIP